MVRALRPLAAHTAAIEMPPKLAKRVTDAAAANSGPKRARITVNHDIANADELHRNTLRVLVEMRKSRPQNTIDSYEPKQEEFKVCVERRAGARLNLRGSN